MEPVPGQANPFINEGPPAGINTPATPPGESVAPAPTGPLSTPVDDAHLVTVPGVEPQAQQERMLEIKRHGETRQVSEAEAIELAQKGWDYTQKMQEFAPYKEMRDFIEQTPGAADAIISLMNQGMPQQQAQQQVYNQNAGQYAPPAQDPGVNYLVQEVANIQAQMEAQQFRGRHPEADFEKVVQHLIDHPEIPNLELAYRDISYEDLSRQASLGQQQQTAQRQQTAVGPGAQGPPESYRVDPRKLTDAEVHEVAKRYHFLE
jgi:uncharacterized beta-barrel protein YwiB (DUF1934 family)